MWSAVAAVADGVGMGAVPGMALCCNKDLGGVGGEAVSVLFYSYKFHCIKPLMTWEAKGGSVQHFK